MGLKRRAHTSAKRCLLSSRNLMTIMMTMTTMTKAWLMAEISKIVYQRLAQCHSDHSHQIANVRTQTKMFRRCKTNKTNRNPNATIKSSNNRNKITSLSCFKNWPDAIKSSLIRQCLSICTPVIQLSTWKLTNNLTKMRRMTVTPKTLTTRSQRKVKLHHL